MVCKANEPSAQGIALGICGPTKRALKGQKLYISMLLPFQGALTRYM